MSAILLLDTPVESTSRGARSPISTNLASVTRPRTDPASECGFRRATRARPHRTISRSSRVRRSPDEIGSVALLSYTDIVCDADPQDLLSLRQAHDATVAVLTVNPRRPWGELSLDGDMIRAIEEKTMDRTRWINGGLFAIAPEVLENITASSEMFEAAPLERIVAQGAAVALRHLGGWAAIDTPKNARYLDGLDADAAAVLLPAPPTIAGRSVLGTDPRT